MSSCIKNIEQYEKQVEIYNAEKALINEYKDAIVAEVITGKIDVRDYEITEEAEAYDDSEEELDMVAEESEEIEMETE